MQMIDYFDFDGHSIAYKSYGKPDALGLPLFFIHGLTASVHFWEAAMPSFVQAHHRWYSISLPLHYPSRYDDRTTAEHSLDEYRWARMLHELVHLLEPGRRVGVIGYSIGGFAALNLSAKHPQHVAFVVSIGGFVRGQAKGIQGTLDYFANSGPLGYLIFRTGFWLMQRHPWFLRQAIFCYAKKDKALKQYAGLEPTIRAIWPDVQRHRIDYQRAWFGLLLNKDLTDELHCIKCPVLVYAGESDPIIPYEHQRSYAHRLKELHTDSGEVRLVSMPAVGHVPFGEDADVFEQELKEWLRKYGVGGRWE